MVLGVLCVDFSLVILTPNYRISIFLDKEKKGTPLRNPAGVGSFSSLPHACNHHLQHHIPEDSSVKNPPKVNQHQA
jgi:hypothetical protein